MSKSRVVLAAALLVAGSRPIGAQQMRSVSPTFEFHSGFWINLHHYLYHLAQPPGPPPRSPAISPLGALTPDERRRWNAVVAYYRAHVIQHDVLFDDTMGQLKEALARAEPDTMLTLGVEDRDVAHVLNDAAPIYRRHWWPTHDRANQLWIAAVRPLITALGPTLAAQLSQAYATPWYPGAIRVDVSAHAGTRLVAYTTGTTNGHIVISSTDPCDQGYAALETLYHEASHTIVDGGTGTIGAGIIAAARARRSPVPDDLWHALMFYTQGELLRRDLADLGIGYEPESGICDVYRGRWTFYRDAAVLFWRPYLLGHMPLDSALRSIVVGVADTIR